jgi:hypothetical protein
MDFQTSVPMPDHANPAFWTGQNNLLTCISTFEMCRTADGKAFLQLKFDVLTVLRTGQFDYFQRNEVQTDGTSSEIWHYYGTHSKFAMPSSREVSTTTHPYRIPGAVLQLKAQGISETQLLTALSTIKIND